MLRAFLIRFAIPILLLAFGATLVSMPVIDGVVNAWFRNDAQQRAGAIMRSLDAPLGRLLAAGASRDTARFLARVATDEHLVAIVICGADESIQATTPFAPQGVACPAGGRAPEGASSNLVTTANGTVQVSDFALTSQPELHDAVLLVHDASFVDRRQSTAREYLLAFVAVSAVVLSLLLISVAWWAFQRWVTALLGDIRGRRFRDDARSAGLSLPLLSQMREALREVEDSQRQEIEYQENWTPTALQHVVRERLESPDILVVSNREPYVHTFGADGAAKVHVPASGMVTALEPIVRACSGTWIAHGSGDADRSVVDRNDGILVPPESPSYRLRRVWLTEEQEAGYYYGLANEGLWPLCHLAYVRPEFRESDWRQYVAVNDRFARVVADEAQSDSPIVLIQDFHFALLPALVRRHKPAATIVHFWHIPWPNPETFGVCPWKGELLAGLLQADILGFHTRYHCHNFLDAVDNYIEGQVDRERMTVSIRGHKCQIGSYPISIEWPPRSEASTPAADDCRKAVRARYHIPSNATLGLGIERWDFTKGILERFAALEHLLETRPQLRGRVTLLQIVSPSRSRLPAYRSLQERTLHKVAELNERFARNGWQPVVLVAEHQEAERVYELYRAADFCLVNSLHDGMNLVAKEFVAARDDEDGVLILSKFAGASRELVEALLVNPYDAIETARAIEVAMHMPHEERRERMRLLRRTVKHNNVFRWAGRMLIDAAQIRQRQRLAARSEMRQARPPLLRTGA
jgi:trehalose 6-phosphate synthase/phosphatase